MNELISKILTSNKVINEKGVEVNLDASIDLEEVNFLQKLIKNNQLSQSLEVGCAMGISSLAICDAINTN